VVAYTVSAWAARLEGSSCAPSAARRVSIIGGRLCAPAEGGQRALAALRPAPVREEGCGIHNGGIGVSRACGAAAWREKDEIKTRRRRAALVWRGRTPTRRGRLVPLHVCVTSHHPGNGNRIFCVSRSLKT